MFVDSHCHLNYLDDPEEKIVSAGESGVGAILCIGVEQDRISEVVGLATRFPRVWCSVGEHPDSAEGSPDWVRDFIDHPKVVAIGETGLDYFREEGRSNRAAQIASFDSQLQIANEIGLPIVVHTRSAEKDTIDLIKNHPSVTGVLHCFTESWEMAKVALDLGFYISISGIVTFKNADQVKEVAKRVPDDRLLIETDAPWLAPVPRRGKPNEPAYVVHTAEYVASLRGQTTQSIGEITSYNFFDLFCKIDHKVL